jgi:hypothetical protein
MKELYNSIANIKIELCSFYGGKAVNIDWAAKIYRGTKTARLFDRCQGRQDLYQ